MSARARHDAVLVGAGTARADDPSLTVRGLGIAHQPVRVVLSRRLDLPGGSALMRTAREVPVWLCHGPEAPEGARAAWDAAGARRIEVAAGPGGQLDLGEVLAALGAAGLTRVFCEGGGTLAAGLFVLRPGGRAGGDLGGDGAGGRGHARGGGDGHRRAVGGAAVLVAGVSGAGRGCAGALVAVMTGRRSRGAVCEFSYENSLSGGEFSCENSGGLCPRPCGTPPELYVPR